MSLRRRPQLVQLNGFFHGGVIAGLADHAAGGGVTTLVPEARIGVTVDPHVNFLAPANGEEIVAKAGSNAARPLKGMTPASGGAPHARRAPVSRDRERWPRGHRLLQPLT